MQEWLQEVNPWALHRMAETLLEAEQRGLWKAREETKEELLDAGGREILKEIGIAV